jgi:hypothetical protein
MMSIKPILTLNNLHNNNLHNNNILNKNENNTHNNNILNKNENKTENNNHNNNITIKTDNNNNILNNKENLSKSTTNNNKNKITYTIEDKNEIENKLTQFNSTLTFNPNPQFPKEYTNEILQHLHSLENTNINNKNNILFPNPNYFSNIQKDIKERMRSILLDWLIEVHLKFKLLPSTLYLTVNILDRYLSLQSIHRKYLQLLGVCSMFISCKYEEIYFPKIKDFIYMTDNAYNKDEFIKMENDILKKLEFNLSFPTILNFLEIYREKLNMNENNNFNENFNENFDENLNNFDSKNNFVKKFNFWRYLSEICLFDFGMVKYKNSLIAGAIVYFENKFGNFEKILENKILDVICEFNSIDDIKEVCEKIKILYKNYQISNYVAIKKKFSLSLFNEVAKEKINF